MFRCCKMSRMKMWGAAVVLHNSGGHCCKSLFPPARLATKPLLSLQSVSLAPVYFVVSILPSTVRLLDFPYLFKLYEHRLPRHMFLHGLYTLPPKHVYALRWTNGSYVYEVLCSLCVAELSLDCTGFGLSRVSGRLSRGRVAA